MPTSVFKDNGDMRITKSDSDHSRMKRKRQVEQSPRTLPTHEAKCNVVDGCSIMLVIQWPQHSTVQYYVSNVLEYGFGKLQHSHVDVIFDRFSHLSVVSWVGLTSFIMLNQLSLPDAHSGCRAYVVFLHVVF